MSVATAVKSLFRRKSARPQVAEPAPTIETAPARAGYDLANSGDWNANHWAGADSYDADSSNSRAVRAKLVTRSRYETQNNGFVSGMTTTHADFLVRSGPTLQVLTPQTGFNTAVETIWGQWTTAIQFRRKLWVMAHAKVQDGEPIAIIRDNPRVRHPVTLDLVVCETEQCQTPMLPWGEVGYIDGIKFDQWGNPEWYDLLPQHPGGAWGYLSTVDPEHVPAEWVLHWFHLQRPGQHRGIPGLASTHNLGAAGRRHRESTLAAAEAAANFSVLLKTQTSPDITPTALASPFSSVPYQKNMMVALPALYDAMQMRAEHPNATYKEFQRQIVSEEARPLAMPHNVASCDSSDHNFASGKLDFTPWYVRLDCDRLDCNDCVLDKLFNRFWKFAVLTYGWAADPDRPPPRRWNWPRHPVADVQAEASANETKLKTGQTTLTRIYDDAGLDYETEIEQMSSDYGLPSDEMKALLRQAIFSNGNQPEAGTDSPNGSPADDAGADKPEAAAAEPVVTKRAALLEMAGGIDGMLAILKSLATGEITRDTAIRLVALFYQLTPEQATAIVDEPPKPKQPAQVPPQFGGQPGKQPQPQPQEQPQEAAA